MFSTVNQRAFGGEEGLLVGGGGGGRGGGVEKGEKGTGVCKRVTQRSMIYSCQDTKGEAAISFQVVLSVFK